MAPAQRCHLCRQTFFCGRGHVYSRKHQRQLKVALDRLLPQVRTGGCRESPGAGILAVQWGPKGVGFGRPTRVPTWPLPSDALSATGGGCPEGCPHSSGGALRARARAVLLVPVL